MAPMATDIMTKKASDDPEQEARFCTYTSVKIDDEMPLLAKRAAAEVGKSVQDLISDLVNEGCSKILGRKPINRRSPPPKGSPPRKGKRSD